MIRSQPFCGTTLTDQDAEKFRRQVTYGRPSPAAVESVRRGVKLASEYERTGKVVFKIKARQADTD